MFPLNGESFRHWYFKYFFYFSLKSFPLIYVCPCEDMSMQAPEVGHGNWASALATGPSLHPAPPRVLVSHSTPVVVLQFFLLSLSLPALSNSLASESPCSWGCPQIPDSPASTSRVPSYRCVPISLAPLVFSLGILFWLFSSPRPLIPFLTFLDCHLPASIPVSSCVGPFSTSSFTTLMMVVWHSQSDNYCGPAFLYAL